jgi:two-component system LytT family response regulator
MDEKITALIVEDEAKSRDNIRAILDEYCPHVSICAESANVKEAIRDINQYQPQLIFLDIELPDGTGFDVLETINTNNLEVIFVTAFGQYAIKAIRFCALDYILKPINIPDLIKAVKRCQNSIIERTENQRLKQLVKNISSRNEHKQLVLPVGNKLEFIQLNDIIYLKSDNNYTTFYIADSKEILVSKPIKEYQSILNDQFIQTHQSYMANINKIKALVKGDGAYLVMNNGSNIPISRNRKEEVIQKLKK